jgi:hypothetical protein
VQSFRAAPLRGLLLALPKSNQKARHRMRWFDSHRANRTSLRFSARRGCSDSTSLYCFASAAIHRRDPAGIFRRGLRCSAPRTAPLIHESVHPCTTSTRLSCELLLLLLRQDAAQTGPPVARRGCAGSVRRRPRAMRSRSLNVHGRTIQRTPEHPREVGRQDAWRPCHRRCVSLVTFLCTSTAPQKRREQRSWRRRAGCPEQRK